MRSSSSASGPFDEVDHWETQPWITSHAPPLESQLGFDTSSLEVPRGLELRKTFFRLVRCQDIVGGTGLEPVVPISESVEPGLHGVGHRQQCRPPCPGLDVPEDPLDLRVEMSGTDLTVDVCEPRALNHGAQPPAELAPVIGHEIARSLSRFVGRFLHRFRQNVRAWPMPERLQGDDLARESIDDRSSLDLLPEHAERRDVEKSDLMRRRGTLDDARYLRTSVARGLRAWVSRWLFLKHAPDRRSADLDVGSHVRGIAAGLWQVTVRAEVSVRSALL